MLVVVPAPFRRGGRSCRGSCRARSCRVADTEFRRSALRADDAEDKAAALVERLGGTVTRDETRPGKPVVAVDLYARRVTGTDLRALAPLQNLARLDLTYTGITSAELKELAPFQQLTTLKLSGRTVTDDGLPELSGLRNLQILDLTRTGITDAGLKKLGAALEAHHTLHLSETAVKDTGLRDLRAASEPSPPRSAWTSTKVTDVGALDLAALKNLRELSLGGTEVTDTGVRGTVCTQQPHHPRPQLNEGDGPRRCQGTGRTFRNLTAPSACGFTKVTDVGALDLAALKNLRELSLGGTEVKDAGVKALVVLKNLTTLDLHYNEVTDTGVKELVALKTSLSSIWGAQHR